MKRIKISVHTRIKTVKRILKRDLLPQDEKYWKDLLWMYETELYWEKHGLGRVVKRKVKWE